MHFPHSQIFQLKVIFSNFIVKHLIKVNKNVPYNRTFTYRSFRRKREIERKNETKKTVGMSCVYIHQY